MKKFLMAALILILTATTAFAAEDYLTPIPSEDDEVTSSGPDTKFSVATQMRYDAFQNAEVSVPCDFPEDKKLVKIYKIAPNKDYLQRVKIPNAKVIEYTNNNYDIKYKEIPNKLFCYDKDGNLTEFAIITNNGKIPFTTYFYDLEGQITKIEIKPERYRSYVYGLDGILMQYRVDDKTFGPDKKMLRRKKSMWF